MLLQREDLIDQIWTEFAAARLDTNSIVSTTCVCEECIDAAEFFANHTREQLSLSPKLIQSAQGAWTFISPQAWYYFLPTYLVASLAEDSSGTRTETIDQLSPRRDKPVDFSVIGWNPTAAEIEKWQSDLQSYFNQRVQQLTRSQRNTVGNWFDYLAKHFSTLLEHNPTFKRGYNAWR